MRNIGSRPLLAALLLASATGFAPRTPLQPSMQTYNARSLYWSNKKELGRSGTAPGLSRSAANLSIHKDVQASQPAL